MLFESYFGDNFEDGKDIDGFEFGKIQFYVEIRVARKVCEINVNQMYFINEIGFSVKCYLKFISMIKLAYVKKS